jgi:hypothetical protein
MFRRALYTSPRLLYVRYTYRTILIGRRASVVGVGTRLMTRISWFDSLQWEVIFLYSKMTGPAPGPWDSSISYSACTEGSVYGDKAVGP